MKGKGGALESEALRRITAALEFIIGANAVVDLETDERNPERDRANQQNQQG